jgi:hypothetical protein
MRLPPTNLSSLAQTKHNSASATTGATSETIWCIIIVAPLVERFTDGLSLFFSLVLTHVSNLAV